MVVVVVERHGAVLGDLVVGEVTLLEGGATVC